jgi:hypothetical protein
VYSKYIGGQDPVRFLDETSVQIDRLVRSWPRQRDEQSYAPGKWTARQLLVHLSDIEMVFSIRLRFALTSDGYVVQPFEQDDWMRIRAADARAHGSRRVSRYAAPEPADLSRADPGSAEADVEPSGVRHDRRGVAPRMVCRA